MLAVQTACCYRASRPMVSSKRATGPSVKSLKGEWYLPMGCQGSSVSSKSEGMGRRVG
jgi:hypothetical protein